MGKYRLTKLTQSSGNSPCQRMCYSGLSGAKPDPDFARSVIAHHCFLKHFNSPEVMKFLFVSLLNTITNSSGQFALDETSTESKVSTVFF